MGQHAWTREYAVQIETMENIQFLGLQTLLAVADATAVTFGVAKIGIGGDGTANGKFKLLTTNKADISTSTAVTTTEKATGRADMTEEDVQVLVAEPSAYPPEMEANAYILSFYLQLLCQTGATQAVSGVVGSEVVTSIFRPYEISDVLYYGAFLGKVPKIGGVSDEAVLMRGALAATISLSAEEGGLLTLSSEIQGAKWSASFNATDLPAEENAILKRPFLKWQNAKVIMDDAYITPADPESGLKVLAETDNTTFGMDGFELNIANGLIAKFYNSNQVQAFVLGKYTAEGSIVIPWVLPGPGGAAAIANKYYWKNITQFRDGITKHLKIYWGHADAEADNSLVIDMYIKYTEGALEGDDVLGSNMNFMCVQPAAGVPSIVIKCGHSQSLLDRGFPAEPV
jgi:hypothetical protein